jgi:hypothetical protein
LSQKNGVFSFLEFKKLRNLFSTIPRHFRKKTRLDVAPFRTGFLHLASVSAFYFIRSLKPTFFMKKGFFSMQMLRQGGRERRFPINTPYLFGHAQ